MLEVELKIRTGAVSTFVLITSRQFGGVVHSHHHARERASPGGRAAHHQTNPHLYSSRHTGGHKQGKQASVGVRECGGNNSKTATTNANNSSRPPAHTHAQQAKQQAQQPRQGKQDLRQSQTQRHNNSNSIDRPHSLYTDGHIIAPAGQLRPQIPHTHRQTDGFVAGEELKMLAPRAAGPAGASSGLPAQLHVHVQPQFQQQQSAFEEAAREIKAATAGAANVSDSDGSYDSPAMERPRRRFVKPTVTTFETCFSRNASTNATKGGHGGGGGMGAGGAGRRYNRRVGAQPRVGLASYSFINSSSTMSMAAAATAEAAQFSNNNDGTTVAKEGDQQMEGVKRAPAVSSLSSVLQELMHGRHRALSNFRDATAPQLNPRTFTVQQDHDGAFYVASSTGEKFAADSAIGKVFLQPAPEKQNASSSFVVTSPKSLASSHGYSGERASDDNAPDFSRSMRRSELDFGSRSSNRKWPSRRSRRDSDESRDSRSSSSSKGKLLGFSSIKSRLAAHRNSHRSSLSRGSVSRDRPMTLDDMAHDHHDVPAVLGGSEDEGPLSFHAAEEENVLPMLDPSLVDSRVRGDSSWEVPAAPLPVARGSATDGRSSTTSSAQPVVDKSKIVNRPIPYASGGGMGLNDDDDDEDEDVNPLNRSFLNVRDIEFHPRTDKETSVSIPVDALDGTCDADADDDDDDDEEGEHGAYQQNQQHQNGGALQQDRATFDAGGSQPRTGSLSSVQDANTGRGSSFSSGAVVRVSSSSGNVSEFLGGFKGQLSTRRGSIGGGPDKGGFVNRTRSVRNGARKSAAALAANQAAALAAHALTRKLLDARSRIPPEFREDMPLPKKKKKGKKLRWDMTLYCREFEVESEDEEDVKPEIVKAPWEYRDSEERDSDSSDGW